MKFYSSLGSTKNGHCAQFLMGNYINIERHKMLRFSVHSLEGLAFDYFQHYELGLDNSLISVF